MVAGPLQVPRHRFASALTMVNLEDVRLLTKLSPTDHTTQLREDAFSSIDGCEDAAVKQQPHHNLISMLTQQPQDFGPWRGPEYANIVVWKLCHETRNVIQSILARFRASVPVCEQVLQFLMGARMPKEALYHEVDYLIIASVIGKPTGVCSSKITSIPLIEARSVPCPCSRGSTAIETR